MHHTVCSKLTDANIAAAFLFTRSTFFSNDEMNSCMMPE